MPGASRALCEGYGPVAAAPRAAIAVAMQNCMGPALDALALWQESLDLCCLGHQRNRAIDPFHCCREAEALWVDAIRFGFACVVDHQYTYLNEDRVSISSNQAPCAHTSERL